MASLKIERPNAPDDEIKNQTLANAVLIAVQFLVTSQRNIKVFDDSGIMVATFRKGESVWLYIQPEALLKILQGD